MKNLKFILFALVGLTLGQVSYAQSGFGVRAGFGLTDQNVTIASVANLNPKSKIGFDIGVLYEMEISQGLSFQPELHYTQMGWKVDAFLFDLKANLDYIRIPLLLKYDVLQNNENLSLSPFAGPYVSFLVNEDVDLLSALGAELPYKGVDVGADFGVMLKLNSGLFFDVRYMLGFSNVSDAEVASLSVGEAKNNGIGVGIGYMF